jgi:hypothetical protein
MKSFKEYIKEDIENIFDILYHVTYTKNLPAIKKFGLIPKINPEMQDKKAVYLFINREALEDALMNWLGDKLDENEEVIVLYINKNMVKDLKQDKNVGYEVYTEYTIPPKAIINYEII